MANYYSTGEPSARKNKYPPIKVTLSVSESFGLVVNYLTKRGCKEVKANEEYYDIFAKDGDYEVSIQLASNAGDCLIQLSVYKEKRLNHVKRLFKNIYEDLEELFADYA